MSFDAIALAAIAAELRETLFGGRVQKVVQAGELVFGLELYARQRRRWLLLSADPQRARVHLAGERLGRAGELVSPLLLLLRKHLHGARLLAVEQPDFERSLALTFGGARPPASAEDADGEPAEPSREPDAAVPVAGVRLIIETIGRYSNLVLVDPAGVVLDSARRVSAEINRRRTILPRQPYVPPPPQEKQPVEVATPADLADRLAAAPPRTAAWQVLVASYAGLSPQLAREAAQRAVGRAGALAAEAPPAEVAAALHSLLAPRQTGEWAPSVAVEGDRVVAFAPYRLTQHLQHADVRPVESISAAVEAYYAQVEQLRPVDQAREAALRALAPRRAAAARKQESLERALAGGQKADRLRQCGESILAHLAEIRRGQDRLLADGLEVELSPALTAVENAQAYFRRYRKARAALTEVPALIEETRLYREYLEQAAAHLALAESADEVRAIERELAGRDAAGSARPARRPGRPAGRAAHPDRRSAVGIARYLSSEGLEILVGRSGQHNDAVTFEHARPGDVWLHARGVAGAHVVVRCAAGEPPARSLEEAARLAARFSASRGATVVAVDWTRRRAVRRLRASLPGLVSYVGERTLHVRPDVPPEVRRVG